MGWSLDQQRVASCSFSVDVYMHDEAQGIQLRQGGGSSSGEQCVAEGRKNEGRKNEAGDQRHGGKSILYSPGALPEGAVGEPACSRGDKELRGLT
ncbi:hypothetical protein cyc_01429 [Cyclospora cayetanensis]|uniref:Uncharacterized protein n=1 Tax=Cyclospora cayetanensis TaxID=88456 RepID=A0A1D3D5U9_9EIME|nr:hypothetical protein cyc_01429 [Cyclospora cayetanensis]